MFTYILAKRKYIEMQPILAFNKFPLIGVTLVRTGWGKNLMEKWATKYTVWVKLFGYSSIGIGFLGLFLMIAQFILIVFILLLSPQQQAVGLVLPFQDIPGIGYLSFLHWVIALVILASVHEFAHGVVARAHKLPVHHSGFGALSILKWIPLIPLAFVEPDEKKIKKSSDVIQYSVLAAGPTSNILLSIPFGILLLIFAGPITAAITEPVGFSFNDVTEGMPAYEAGVQAGVLYTHVNGELVTNANAFLIPLQFATTPGDTISIGREINGQLEFLDIQTTMSDDGQERAVIGVVGVTSVTDFKENFSQSGPFILWLKDLIKWIFIFNLFIGLMNLAPIFITDGGQMIRTLAISLYPKEPKKSHRMYILINKICLFILLGALFIPLFARLF